ncbi:hypothetical protein BDW_08080 [Bdellovibrio bacteriovorus W]|nr:hypothetical protein BDW_08080 [Bdellovibrio bacteriovorus W]
MKTIFSFFATILFSANAFSQTAADLTCRAEAKKMALDSYTLCVDRHNEARSKELNTINKEYQQEAAALKAKYEAKIQQVISTSAPMTKAAPASTQKQPKVVAPVAAKNPTVIAPKPVKGVAKQLPTKSPTSQPEMQIQTVTEGAKVVSVTTEDTTGIEAEAAQAEVMDIAELPAE